MWKVNGLIIAILFCTLRVCGQVTSEPDSVLIMDVEPPAVIHEAEEDERSYEFSRFRLADTVNIRIVPEATTDSLRKLKQFAYANDPEYWSRAMPQEDAPPGFIDAIFRFFSKPAVRAFVYILLIILAIFILVRVIVINRLYIFNRSSKTAASKQINAEHEPLLNENLDARIAKAISDNDQRNAIRFLYLKTLQLLDKKGWISVHPQATNYEYRAQVNRYAKGEAFEFLSSVYEHVYYGDFRLKEDQFKRVLNNFNHFHNSLHV